MTIHFMMTSPVPVNSPHKGQWRGALMFSLICVWINGWVNNREAGDLRHHRGHYDVSVMCQRTHNDIHKRSIFHKGRLFAQITKSLLNHLRKSLFLICFIRSHLVWTMLLTYVISTFQWMHISHSAPCVIIKMDILCIFLLYRHHSTSTSKELGNASLVYCQYIKVSQKMSKPFGS